MPRKRKSPPKAQQIKMVRGALKSRKTPRHLLPSLRKRLRALTAAAAFLFVLLSAAVPAHAQFLGYTSAQSVQQTLATNVACTGSAQSYNVQNYGQTYHSFYIKSADIGQMAMTAFGVDAAGNEFQISDTSTIAYVIASQSNPILQGYGYYPIVRVKVTCNGGTYTLSYSGTSASPSAEVGGFQLAHLDKVICAGVGGVNNCTEGASYTQTFIPPNGNSFGLLHIQLTGALPAGSFFTVNCAGTTGTTINTFNFYPPTGSAGIFVSYVVPNSPCMNETIDYTAGGASAGLFSFGEDFFVAGESGTQFYFHIPTSTTTAQVVKPGTGTLASIIVGSPAAGTISVFDLAPAACTATPTTNVVAVLTIVASTQPPVIPFNGALFSNGICVKLSASMDATVVYQ